MNKNVLGIIRNSNIWKSYKNYRIDKKVLRFIPEMYWSNLEYNTINQI